ncbi:MAG: hypothetical protein VKJ09_10700 [Leptolyngbya sp.]|nr:hypothetical protein [Leptolyngbya sp.]
MNTALTNGHRAPTANFRTMTVAGFFGQVPWEGPPTFEGLLGTAEPGAVAPLSKQLTVAEFFNRFMWEGVPTIAAPMAPLEIQSTPSAAETFTLEDFSSLF